ncbi:bifunctional UDP-sugar hydrolase/5'-nucleotidase [Sporosarcina sp. FSL W7-1349]|uniref:bifunctional metallophosphatase/5'-nucleotidase n=1 Tax=Sporosarcina sp. FSL W7-1349 TaxID=2921561 RepID=UPI0030F5C9C8
MKQRKESIHFYHTNDIHSHFESWPQISRYLRTRKEEHAARAEACFVVDIGDHVDRSHPFTEGTNGLGNVALLNAAGYDAVTIGNNEGITMSKKALNSLYQGARFDVILGNLFELDGSQPKWSKPYHIYTTGEGTRIGIIGATAPYPVFYSKLGWEIVPGREQLKKMAEQLEAQTDIIVCLSHLGVNEDRLLASECSLIDVIFGAHTHHLFPKGEFIGSTLLAATGKFGEYVGEVVIEWDVGRKQIALKQASVHRADRMAISDSDVQEVNELMEDGKRAMEEKVFHNPYPLNQNLFAPSPLSSFFGRALIAYTDADCAMFNAGIFLGSLDAGWVTKEDLHSLLPHPINLCVITLEGHELMDIYELSLNEEWPHIEIKGLGFRGALMGAMIHERLYKNKAGKLFAGNREVVPDGIYKLATLDMFTFGYFFPTLQFAEKEYYMPELIRDIFGWYGTEYF